MVLICSHATAQLFDSSVMRQLGHATARKFDPAVSQLAENATSPLCSAVRIRRTKHGSGAAKSAGECPAHCACCPLTGS